MLMQTVEVQRIDPNYRLVPSTNEHEREAVEYSTTSIVYFLVVIERVYVFLRSRERLSFSNGNSMNIHSDALLQQRGNVG